MMNDNRNRTIDIAKGLGIIIVGIFHMVYRKEGSIPDQLISEGIWFLIPFFFFITGWNYNFSKRTVTQNIIRRGKNLLLPTLKYTASLLIIGGVYFYFFHDYTLQQWLDDVIVTYLRPEFSSLFIKNAGDGLLFDVISPVWFVWAMLWASPLFYVLADYANKNLVRLTLCCSILIVSGILLYDFRTKISWSLTLVPVYVAVMLCAAYINKTITLKESFTRKYSIVLVISAVIIHIIMFQLYGTHLVFLSMAGTIGRWSIIPFFIQTFVGGYAFIFICRMIEKLDSLAKILEFIGINSLVFLLFHRAFGVVFSDIFHTYIKSGEYWYVELTPKIFIESFIIWVLSMICCSVFCMVKDK